LAVEAASLNQQRDAVKERLSLLRFRLGMLSPIRLRVLIALSGSDSFSQAAEALDYTQSAVSKQLAALEREVGTQLVQRQVRPIRLTPAGEALARHAKRILEGLAAAEAELDAIAALETGRLRIGTYASAGATLVVQAVAAFRRRHPGIELSLVEAGRDKLLQDVRSGELDVAAVFDFPALGLTIDEGLEARHLLDEPHSLLLPPDHRLARKTRVAIADLRDEDWLFPTLAPDSPTQKLFTAVCAAAGYEPRIVFRVNDCEMHQALVAAGVGLGFLPQLALHPIHPGVIVKPVAEAPKRRILAVALPGVRPGAVEVFLELLEEFAAAYPTLQGPARV
jgi:DNA-binding transcriptional LysR family regulator